MPYADPGKARERKRRLAAERIARGTCPKCGLRPPDTGRRLCAPCCERRNARERARWSKRRSRKLCGACGSRTSNGAARCPDCLSMQRNRPSQAAYARRRYVRRRARNACVDCGAWAGPAARCPECARTSCARSAEHRGLPAGPARFTVIALDSGDALGVWDTLAEARASVAFARLSIEDVEIVSDIPEMATLTGWA